jgi:hypothetical protein
MSTEHLSSNPEEFDFSEEQLGKREPLVPPEGYDISSNERMDAPPAELHIQERGSQVKRWTKQLADLGLAVGIALHFEAAKPWDKSDAEQPRPADTIESMERDYLDQVYGDYYSLGELGEGVVVANPSQDREITLEGVSEVKGLGDENLDSLTVHHLFVDTFPKGWTDRLRIQFQPGVIESLPDVYGIKKIKSGEFDPETRTVRLFETGVFHELQTYAHEMGHANDWTSDRGSPATRTDLLYRVTQRYLSGDKLYQSEYVNSINNPNANVELYKKVSEYYAEISMAYFTQNEWLKREHPADWDLINTEATLRDRQYNAEREAEGRSFTAAIPIEAQVIQAVLAQRPDLFDLPNIGELRMDGLKAPAEKMLRESNERSSREYDKFLEQKRDQDNDLTFFGVPETLIGELTEIRRTALPDFSRFKARALAVPIQEAMEIGEQNMQELRTMLTPFCEVNDLDVDMQVQRTFEWLNLQSIAPPYGYRAESVPTPGAEVSNE